MLNEADPSKNNGKRATTTAKTILPSKSTVKTPHKIRYKSIEIIGQGAFGVVYSARTEDGSIVAIKRVMIDPRYKNREYDILKKINNINCIRMLNVYKNRGVKNEIYLNFVMEFLPSSLHQFCTSYRKARKFPPLIYVRLFGFQIFAGLNYLHTTGITHRDLKPQNVLVNQDTGELKICDFGSAKELKDGETSVSYIGSRFYRAPELMYNCPNYTSAIDIWAAGLVMAELLNAGSPLFQGRSSIGQLLEIIRVLGPPTQDDLKSFKHEDVDYSSVIQKTELSQILPKHTPPDILDLLKQIFVYNPGKRPTALQCMHHKCFNRLFSDHVMLPNKRPLPFLNRDPSYDDSDC